MADVTDDEGAAAGGGRGEAEGSGEERPERIFLSTRVPLMRPRKRTYREDSGLRDLAEIEDVSDIEANQRYLRERVQLLFDQGKALETQVTELVEIRASLETEIERLKDEIRERQVGVSALEERGAELREQQRELLSSLSDFGYLLASSPLLQNLPFAVVESWNRLYSGQASIREVLRPLYDSLVKELRTLAAVLTTQGVITADLSARPMEWAPVDGAEDGPSAPLVDVFRSIFEMLRTWNLEGGAVDAVRVDLKAVHDRIRYCASSLDVSLEDIGNRENADAFERLQNCVSIPTALLRAYIDSLEIE